MAALIETTRKVSINAVACFRNDIAFLTVQLEGEYK
jgi:hypothetical protein